VEYPRSFQTNLIFSVICSGGIRVGFGPAIPGVRVLPLRNQTHDLAVLDLALDASNRNDLVLLKRLLEPFVARQVDGWHERGKVSKIMPSPSIRIEPHLVPPQP
jgi:hypothetical protein